MYSTNNYLIKRGISTPWKIHPTFKQKFSHAMVIPCLNEYEHLPVLLKSIEKNGDLILKNIIIIIVINNSEIDSEIIKYNNKKTYELLINNSFDFTIGIIDAFSKKLELPKKYAGVGLARKIGMDLAIPYLINDNSLIFSTDADSIINKNYFKTIINHFNTTQIQAAVVKFKHINSNDRSITKQIIKYENFLKNTANKMKASGSPYGYVSMGSTMICTVKAYVSIGGMPKKKATEDFYFLQALSKYCGVKTINKILVYPSSRLENRIYLGTGYRMIEAQKGFDINSLCYSDHAFNYLKKWLAVGTSSWKLNFHELFNKTNNIDIELTKYIINENIKHIWPKLQASSSSKIHFINQFHRWFDALKTIRFLKFFTKILIP